MENRDTPAMPIEERTYNGDAIQWYGLTKLEYFTAKAMQGLCVLGENSVVDWKLLTEEIAIRSVEIAKATLNALEKDGE